MSKGFVMTLPELDEGAMVDEEDSGEEERPTKRAKLADGGEFASNFTFDAEDSGMKPWTFDHAKQQVRRQQVKTTPRTTVDEKIRRLLEEEQKSRQPTKSTGKEDESGDDESLDDGEGTEGEHGDDTGAEGTEGENDSGDGDDDGEDGDEGDDADEEDGGTEDMDIGEDRTRDFREYKPGKKKDKFEFFAKPPPQIDAVNSFDALNLSRPLLKAISEIGWSTPSPIQQQAIPLALNGRDIAGSAVTGSGKTGAFVLPILERLLYRDTRTQTTRVLILTPTRELGAQCHSVITNLAKYTNDIRCALVLGGLSLAAQSLDLRSRPDIIVATPGRLIDHLLNTQSFGLENLEILVLDEADRLLEMGFAEEIKQIVQACPKQRQTILFSATMTEKVSELAKLSLNRPVRVTVDPLFHTSKKLLQEFVKVKQNSEIDREAVLLALCTRTFRTGVLIFCSQKVDAHRLKIIFGLAGLKAAELHGNLTQIQRLEALEQFRDGVVEFLLATDVASRGLDIMGIQTVINFSLPNNEASYVHRVGRTARAGRKGIAVSLVGDTGIERRLLRLIVKHSAAKSCKHRIVPANAIKTAADKILGMADRIKNVMAMEKEETILRKAEMEATKLENLVIHRDEIESRPARTWFISEKEKQQIKEKTKEEYEKQAQGVKDQNPKKRKREDMEAGEPHQQPYHALPVLKRKPTRKERKRNAVEVTLTPNQFKLAKKKYKKVSQLKIQQGIDDKKKRRDQKQVQKQKKREKASATAAASGTAKEEAINANSNKKKVKRGGNFKSKKKHKRR